MTSKLSPKHAVQKRKALFLPLVLAFLLGPPLALQATPDKADGWVIECVDCPEQFSNMTNRSLRLDTAGHPHIAYGGEHLDYAWYDGVGWHRETADDSPNVGQYASLALDGDSHPYISYYDGTNDDLKYAYQDDSGWHIETVDSEEYVGSYTSLALDRNGYPHISYHGTSYHDETKRGFLKYAYQDHSGWHIETIDNENFVGEYTSLALNKDGYPHISYYDYANHDLKYAYQDASGWHIQTVDSKGYVGRYSSLALDEGCYPHISYQSNGSLKYVYQDASGWHIETVDSEGDVGWYTSLALDETGDPHISYYDEANGDLKYTYQDASGWHIQTVDSEGLVGEYTSLALNDNGYPHISYYYCGTARYPCDVGDLKYTYQDGSGWHIQTVDSEGLVGEHTSLALNDNGYPHISYFYCGTARYPCDVGDVKYAYYSAWKLYLPLIRKGAP